MSTEIKYVGGKMDGKTKRVRSLGEQPSEQRSIWREFKNNKATGREINETYRLNRETREYALIEQHSS